MSRTWVLTLLALVASAMAGCAVDPATPPTRPAGLQLTGRASAASALTREAAMGSMSAALARFAMLEGGRVADHNTVAASADPAVFAIAVATSDGEVWSVGDDEFVFPLQSISKIFTLGLAIEDYGDAVALERVGVHATGLPFGSLAAMEIRATALQNPMVSAGAIATTSLVEGRNEAERWSRTRRFLSGCAGRELASIEQVFTAESASDDASLAKAYALSAHGLLYAEPRATVERYLQACSVGVSVRDLAVMGMTLGNGGVNPATGMRVLERESARGVLSAMVTAGMYDDSGPWFYRVGMPAKSGVSGGVVAVAPGRLAISVYSAPLDGYGNSVRGSTVVEALAAEWELHSLDRLLRR